MNKSRPFFYQRGVSLLELLIYVAVFSIIIVFLASIFPVLIRSRSTANARFETGENMRTATEKIQQSLFDASDASISGTCPLNSLVLTVNSVTVTYRVQDNLLQVQNGTDPFENITTNKVIAETPSALDCLFIKVANPAPAKATLQVKIKIRYDDKGAAELKFSDATQFTTTLR